MSQCTNEIQEIIGIDQKFTFELQELCEKLFSRNINELSDPNELDEEIGRLKHLSKYDQCERKIILIRQEINDKAQRIEEYLNTLADLEVEKSILLVDYNVQSNYQKSFINGLDLVMDLLISQFSRLQFVTQAFNIEFDNHKSLHKLLKNVINELNQRCQNIKDRMKLMSATDFSDPKIEKTVVESNDQMLFSIKKLMNLDINPRNLMKRNTTSTFVTYESLKERMSEILQERDQTHNDMVEELKAQYEFMKASEEIEKTLTSILYKDSYTSELLLTPRKFSDLQNSFRHKTTFLQPKLNLITKDLNLQDHLENKKLLFHRYYTDPVWKN
ncbi:1504_t:CDS:2 [Diversispora eburnea]|uniref:1504_t:CDS:1 n=1 Tax=Diversispora eburnea TaxID=1213867 RepID=A0A9N9G0B6_9GLOM|nr:1504_t:CDS:2 [Diversispora eburnea]